MKQAPTAAHNGTQALAEEDFDIQKLGSQLKSVRERRGMAMRAVAELAGYSVTHISQIERGRTCPTIGALARIARALGCGPSYFLESQPRPEVHFESRGGAHSAEKSGQGWDLSWISPGIAGGKLAAGILEITSAQASKPVHVNPPYSVLMHVVSGEAKLQTAAGEHHLGAGDAFHLSANVEADFTAVGPGGFQALYLVQNEGATWQSGSEISQG